MAARNAMLPGEKYTGTLRTLVGRIWLYGLLVAPEVLAAPYNRQLHTGAATVGLFMAADPVGATIGTLLLTWFVPADRQTRWLGPLAAASEHHGDERRAGPDRPRPPVVTPPASATPC
jgi:hypothetical protein